MRDGWNMQHRLPVLTLTLASVLALILLSGCCAYFDPTIGGNTTIGDGGTPVVSIEITNSKIPEGASPDFTYKCYDPDNDLEWCEMSLDGETIARGTSQDDLFPDGYEYPDSYWNALEILGGHEMKITAMDKLGNVASDSVAFTVTEGAETTKPGWYTCNNATSQPCLDFEKVYCDKFTPSNIDVRAAASDAIKSHPGAYSVNQLLDVYDWVHTNVFYQNVPVDFTYQPYTPSETLKTKSGDCKNQALLLASMVEAIGGYSRILLIPECGHAFTEVYVGNNDTKSQFNDAVWAHYRNLDVPNKSITWHSSRNGTEIWMPFDTAGGRFPGRSIEDCFNATTVYVIYNCGIGQRPAGDAEAPNIENIEYGPFDLYNKNMVIEPGRWTYFTYTTGTEYRFCRYSMSFQSLSTKMSWYVIDQSEYENFRNDRGYSYYYREENVMYGNYQIDWSKTTKFNVIIENKDKSNAITVKASINSTCYK